MTKNKKILGVLAIIILTGFLAIGLIVQRTQLTTPSEQDETSGSDTQMSKEVEEKLNSKLNELGGSTKTINKSGDFSLNVQSENYSIIYFPKNKSFNISITASPFERIRRQAENDFLKKMGPDEQFICSLNVVITTPRFANPDQAGRNYPLSFCQ
jgi:hypothetical protein